MRALLKVLLAACVLVMPGLIPAAHAARPLRALVVGQSELAGEFQACLEHFGARVQHVESLAGLKPFNLKPYDALVLCAPLAPKPLELDAAQSRAVAGMLARGGRVYAEYARFAPESLPGWSFKGEPILNRFENIAVTRANAALSGLEKDDLLEEHNSYLLNPAFPAAAEELLSFGLYMGTYKVARQIKDLPTFFNITVDLGKELKLASAEQWYGGLASNYAPDLVKVSLAGEDKQFREVGQATFAQMVELKAKIALKGQSARYVRFYVTKQKQAPATDFVVLNGIEIYDAQGRNVALNRPYEFQLKEDKPKLETNGTLTNGEKPRPWGDDRTHLYSSPALRGLNQRRWPALLAWDHGQGRLYYATTSVSTFRKNNYRLTSRWEALVRGLSLSLFPEAQQAAAAAKWIPLEAASFPRRWSLPGQPVELRLTSAPGARITAKAQGLDLPAFTEEAPGRFVARLTPAAGEYEIHLRADREAGWNESKLKLTVADRRTMYRRALDRNMQWFLKAGVLPQSDGSAGILSTIEVGALYAGKAEDLPSAFRADCQAMSGKAFYLYGDVSGDKAWHRRGENLARFLMRCQFTDPAKPTYGGFRWLLEGNNAIYPQDDNNRNSEFLSWLYMRTGNPDYLRPAVASVEFARDTSREDWTIAYWVVDPETILAKGRPYMRSVSSYANVTDWCLFRHHYAWRATGDPLYRQALEELLRIYGGATLERGSLASLPDGGLPQQLRERGFAIAMHYLPASNPLRQRLAADYDARCAQVLNRPDVRELGDEVQTRDIDSTEIGYAFNNDCSTHTYKDEPLTDQLYTTSLRSVMRWEAYKAAPSDPARRAVEAQLDYLVRIQLENPDPRLDGCWLRSFDMKNWEYYGTRYDPNYGAYHAYTGWMNSMISEALACYLLDEDPFAVNAEAQRNAAPIVTEVRRARQPDYLRETNWLKGVRLAAERQPDLGSKSLASLTDGVIEGIWKDGLSAGWSMPAGPGELTLTLKGDLGRSASCRRLSVRLGGLDAACFADRVVLLAGESPERLEKVLDAQLTSADGSNWLEFTERPMRYVEIRLTKRNSAAKPATLYVGEVQLLGLGPSTTK